MNDTISSRCVLALNDLSRSYGSLKAVSNVNLSINSGERRVVFGANGAGKSTLINLIAGDIRPSSGSISFLGKDVTENESYERSRKGMRRTYQRSSVFKGLTVMDNLIVAISGSTRNRLDIKKPVLEHRKLATEMALRIGLDQKSNALACDLSHGQQRQLELGMTLCGPADLLLLDEPAAGLSPSERSMMLNLIKQLPKETTLMFIEHDIEWALSIAETASVMHNGVLVATGKASEIGDSPVVKEVYLGSKR